MSLPTVVAGVRVCRIRVNGLLVSACQLKLPGVIGIWVRFTDMMPLQPKSDEPGVVLVPQNTPGALGKVGEGPASSICQLKLVVPLPPITRVPTDEQPGLLPDWNLPPLI